MASLCSILLIPNFLSMTRGPIIAIILAILWTLSGLSGSGWFWIFLMIFPIYTLIMILNAGKKFNPDDIGWWAGVIISIIFVSFIIIAWGWISVWSVIIFLYIVALIVVLGATFSSNTSRWVFLFLGIIIGIFLTSFISWFLEQRQLLIVTPTPPNSTATSTWWLK